METLGFFFQSNGNVKREIIARNWTHKLPYKFPNSLGLMVVGNEEGFNDLMILELVDSKSRNSWIRTHNSWIRARNSWIWTRNSWIWISTLAFEFELVLLSFQLVTRNSQLVIRHSRFNISLKSVVNKNKNNCYFNKFLEKGSNENKSNT